MSASSISQRQVRVGDEVGRDVALVELHALDEFERRLGGLAFLDGDDAVLADLLEGVGHQLADRRVVVGGDRGDLRHFFLRGEPLGHASRRYLTAASTALLMPRLTAIGLAPAVMLRRPSW